MLTLRFGDQAHSTGRPIDILLPEVPANLVYGLKQRALDVAGLRYSQDFRMID